MKNNNLIGVLPSDDVLSQCIHCGMCLATCPTYNLNMNERSSPRGRIRMIKAVARGEMEISPLFADEMDFCLDCQACETACPAGVKYGSMVEAARVEVENAGFSTFFGRIMKKLSLQYLLKYKWMLNAAARVLWLYQRTGLQKMLHESGLFKFLFPKLSEFDKLAPQVSDKFSSTQLAELLNSNPDNLYKTAFLSGCVMDVAFADINMDTVEVLTKMNCSVFTPKDQVCCGSIHAHNGDMETAKELARKNIDAFSKQEFQYIIANSAGCGAFMKEYGHVLKDDKEYAEKAEHFSKRVKDVSEFLYDNLNHMKFKSLPESITYHDACHLAHTQKVVEQPRTILNQIPDIKYTPLPESTWCCGSAGVYNIVRYDDSMEILKRKMENIKKTNAKVVLAANPGCILQLQYGCEKFEIDCKIVHPISVINQAL